MLMVRCLLICYLRSTVKRLVRKYDVTCGLVPGVPLLQPDHHVLRHGRTNWILFLGPEGRILHCNALLVTLGNFRMRFLRFLFPGSSLGVGYCKHVISCLIRWTWRLFKLCVLCQNNNWKKKFATRIVPIFGFFTFNLIFKLMPGEIFLISFKFRMETHR